MDEGRAVDVIYLNFSKAFDTIFHDFLVTKFGHYSLDEWTTRWIKYVWMIRLRS